ncbi:hypothetical protein BTHE_1881 [Bifidobacterium thermophilum]|nr:hypothetical protein BTHE_1881 [Bifidobacterium thermophilum]
MPLKCGLFLPLGRVGRLLCRLRTLSPYAFPRWLRYR